LNRTRLDSDIRSLFTDNPDKKHITRIGSGNNRVVYQINGSVYGEDVEGDVVKVSPVGGENKEECNVWDHLRFHDIGDNLVSIKYRADDFVWIVMPYYRPIEPSNVDGDLYGMMSKLGTDISKDDFVREISTENEMCCDYATISLGDIHHL